MAGIGDTDRGVGMEISLRIGKFRKQGFGSDRIRVGGRGLQPTKYSRAGRPLPKGSYTTVEGRRRDLISPQHRIFSSLSLLKQIWIPCHRNTCVNKPTRGCRLVDGYTGKRWRILDELWRGRFRNTRECCGSPEERLVAATMQIRND